MPSRPAVTPFWAFALLALAVLGVSPPRAHGQPSLPPPPPASASRPQTPKPPFPYKSQDVAFETAGGARLAGTLTTPPGPGPFPAVLLINGSGPNDRDETVYGHKPFLILADALTRRGLAVLRYDKRGVGASTGASPNLTTPDFAADAGTALAWLRHRPDVEPAKVGLLGHSEGGAIAALVASKDPRVAFVVLLATPALPGDQILLAKSRIELQARGAPADRIDQIESANRDIYDIAKSDLPVDDASTRIQARLIKAGVPASNAPAIAKQGLSPWLRWYLRTDPRPILAQIHCPVLVLDGAKDTQVIAAQNLPEMRTALAGNPHVTVTELAGLNHLFQTADTGSPREYGVIQESFSPLALKLIVDWISGVTLPATH